MAKLSYRTKGNSNPQGKERVYFACHPDDFETCFEAICADIFSTQNCAVFYNSEPETSWDAETMELELGRMQLIVIPVTSRFLYKDNEAREAEFVYAMEHHIPVLPLLQESGLENAFNRICGDLQFLDKNADLRDSTALPYNQKLEKFLKSVLLGDELAEKVRKAFDAYIFLSYRKKDRKYAQELMRLIHKNDFCRDIAIWYDEFLVPGENFNDAIAEAMTRSDLFTFVVTPSLLEPDNYVMAVEYPEAIKAGKPILPAEMVQTDICELGKSFENFPDLTDAHNELALSQALLDKLRALAISENDSDPAHIFFIGLAYLSGIDVEEDRYRGAALIEAAAEQNLPEAMEKLAQMYETGEGVIRNYNTAAKWLDRLAKYQEKRFEESGTEEEGLKLLYALWDIGYDCCSMWRFDKAKAAYEKMSVVSSKMWAEFGRTDFLWYLSVSYHELGIIWSMEGNPEKAEAYYKKDMLICEQIAPLQNSADAQISLSISYRSLGDVYRREKNYPDARRYYEKSLEIMERLTVDQTPKALRSLSLCYIRMGDICRAEGKAPEARKWYEMGIQLSEQLAAEAESDDSCRDLRICYGKMGALCKADGTADEAKGWYIKGYKMAEQAALTMGTVDSYRGLRSACKNICEICLKIGDVTETKNWYQKLVDSARRLAIESGNPSDYNDLGIAYYKLAKADPSEVDIERLQDAKYVFLTLTDDNPQSSTYNKNLGIVRKALANAVNKKRKMK